MYFQKYNIWTFEYLTYINVDLLVYPNTTANISGYLLCLVNGTVTFDRSTNTTCFLFISGLKKKFNFEIKNLPGTLILKLIGSI